MDIRRWQDEPRTRRALEQFADYQATLQTALEVQAIAAPTFDERDRTTYAHAFMQRIGLHDIMIDDLGNVYGRRPGSVKRPALMVSAHLDTVFPRETDLRIRHEGERIYGPGLGDNSIGVAGLLNLAAAMQTHDLPNAADVWFVANVGEEGLGDLCGMRAAVDRLQAKLGGVIVLEGCDFGTIHHHAIGVRRYRISASAPGGHSWGNFGAPSAIHILVRLAARLTEISVPANPRTTFNIGTISGGTSVNTIAQHAELLLDMRSVNPTALGELVNRVDETIARTAGILPADVFVNIETVGDRPSGAIAREHPIVQATIAAYQSVGAPIHFQQSSTDANIPLSRGIPAVCIGLTDGGNAHRTDEYIYPANLGRGMQALTLMTMLNCG